MKLYVARTFSSCFKTIEEREHPRNVWFLSFFNVDKSELVLELKFWR